MFSRLLGVCAIAGTLLFAGCAATVTKNGPSQTPLNVSASAKKDIIFQVKPARGMPGAGNWDALKNDWRYGMALAADKASMHLTWQDGDAIQNEAPGVFVVVNVRNFQYMEPESRLLGGVLAGNAYLNAEIEFYELPMKRLLGTRVYGTSTSAMEGIFSATTKEQIKAMSTEIVKEIRQ